MSVIVSGIKKTVNWFYGPPVLDKEYFLSRLQHIAQCLEEIGSEKAFPPLVKGLYERS